MTRWLGNGWVDGSPSPRAARCTPNESGRIKAPGCGVVLCVSRLVAEGGGVYPAQLRASRRPIVGTNVAFASSPWGEAGDGGYRAPTNSCSDLDVAGEPTLLIASQSTECSYAYATRMSSGSSKNLPTSCMLAGSPAADLPTGTASAGWPV